MTRGSNRRANFRKWARGLNFWFFLCFLLSLAVFISCVNKKSREKGELRSIGVLTKADASVELLLLKSFGIQSYIQPRTYSVPGASSGQTGTSGINFSGLSIDLQAAPESVVRQILPLYSQVAQSKVRFNSGNSSFILSDLMSPAVQAVAGRELRLNEAGTGLTSADAILSLLTSDGSLLRFTSQSAANVANLFLDGVTFKTVGEIPSFSKPVGANSRERNSGFAVGDLLIFSDKDSPSDVKHLALWLDYDVYFEALPLEQSIVFRFASYAQVLQELTIRSQSDVRQLRMTIVRKGVSWNDVLARIKQFREQKAMATAKIISDALGRGVASSLEGFTFTALSERGPAQAQ